MQWFFFIKNKVKSNVKPRYWMKKIKFKGFGYSLSNIGEGKNENGKQYFEIYIHTLY